MASRRMINGNVWEDQFFLSLTMFERILWLGVLTACADDQGRLQDHPALIRSKVFPVDDISLAEIETAITKFAKEDKIVRYTVDGKKCIQIINWWKHQTPRWAGKSTMPSPKGWTDRERYHTTGNEIVTVGWDSKGGYIDGYLVPNTTNDVNDDVNDDNEEKKPAAAPIFYCPPQVSESIFTAVTQMATFPASDRQDAIDAIRAIAASMKSEQEVVDRLNPFYSEWKARNYHKTNLAWLTDWAVSGEIPPQKKNGDKPRTKILKGPNFDTNPNDYKVVQL